MFLNLLIQYSIFNIYKHQDQSTSAVVLNKLLCDIEAILLNGYM